MTPFESQPRSTPVTLSVGAKPPRSALGKLAGTPVVVNVVAAAAAAILLLLLLLLLLRLLLLLLLLPPLLPLLLLLLSVHTGRARRHGNGPRRRPLRVGGPGDRAAGGFL